MPMFRRLCLGVAAGAMTITSAVAQQPSVKAPQLGAPVIPAGGNILPVAAPARPIAPDAKTLAHLQAWESGMANVKQYYCLATRTVTEQLRKTPKVQEAQIWLSKPYWLRVDMCVPGKKSNDPGALEQFFLSDDKTFYHVHMLEKQRTTAAINGNSSTQLLVLQLMAGLTAKDVTNRFTVKTDAENENFVRLLIYPVYAEDKENFQVMSLTLFSARVEQKAYIPRQIVIDDGKSQDIWDFPAPMVNPKGMGVETFGVPKLPAGFKDNKLDGPKSLAKPFDPRERR